MSAFILWQNKTACFYWIISIILVIIMLYYVLAAIFYLIFVHRHQKQMQKKELLTNLNDNISVQFQRFRLWVAGHANRIIFVLLSCCDMVFEISSTSIASDGDIIVNKPGSFFTVSCLKNAFIRFIFYMVSNFVFSLFSWYKCRLVYTLMQPTESVAKCIPIFIKLIFWYIVITYPAFTLWGCFEIHSNSWNEVNGEMRLCYLYFPSSLFGIYFAHDLALFVLLFILFMIPLYFQHKRAKRLQTFGQKKKENMNYSYDEYTNYFNISKDTKLTMQKQQNDTKPIHSGYYISPKMVNNAEIVNEKVSIFRSVASASQQNLNDGIVTDELQSAMIRNGIAGSLAVIAATLFLTAFYYASWDISTHSHSDSSNAYRHEQRLWTSGFILMGNMLRYLVLYLCMTVTYKDWTIMLFPWRYCCISTTSKTHLNSNSYHGGYIVYS